MINLNETLEITVTGHLSQIVCGVSEHYNDDSFVTTVSLETMYLNKYSIKDYSYTLHPFNVRCHK